MAPTLAQNSTSNIEKALSEIWESLEGSQKAWASLFNIVLYTKNAPGDDKFKWLLDLISKKYPCRTIFISENPAPAEEYLKVNVTAEALGEGEMSVVCDQIFIEVAGKEREKVPFLILPHFIPDLPIYVIWTQEPCENDPLLFQLERYATKVIYDPSNCHNLQTYCGIILKQIQECQECNLTDLVWILISGWREVLTKTFNIPERIDQLFHARIIRITYNQLNPGVCFSDETQALYLQAWIAAQFNWKFKDFERIEGNVRVSYARFMTETVVLLIPESHPELPGGAIINFEVQSSDNDAHFLFKRSLMQKKVSVFISTRNSCDIPYHVYFTQANIEHMLVSELFRKGTSPQYRNVITLLYELRWNENL